MANFQPWWPTQPRNNMAITFSSQYQGFKPKGSQALKSWIKQVIEKEKKSPGSVSYIFVDDETLLRMNREYLKHDTYTDIVTFDYTENKTISGDIFISIDRVKENAEKFGVDFEEELKRVIIHGVLHLCGYKDKTRSDSETMRKKENAALKLFHTS
jgi:probable rRNA maturation factor